MARYQDISGALSARYIDIKRFAVHDGPGIRTTLFLKGCPLRCIWCHNPEGRLPQPELAIHYRKCTFCGECAKVCSCHKIAPGVHEFDRPRCKSCGNCEHACPSGALELFGRTMTVDEAAEKFLEDRIFYADGGGITLSGGEPLLQADFCAELLKRMRGEGIGCAVDTCGQVPWAAFEKVLPYTDIFLYDFKCADPEKHEKLTGCRNDLVLENLTRLDATGANIEIRMIMVPGCNMDDGDLRAAGATLGDAGRFLAGLPKPVGGVRLLAYRAFSHAKYQSIGHPDTMPDVPSPDAEALEKCADVLREYTGNVVNSLK